MSEEEFWDNITFVKMCTIIDMYLEEQERNINMINGNVDNQMDIEDII